MFAKQHLTTGFCLTMSAYGILADSSLKTAPVVGSVINRFLSAFGNGQYLMDTEGNAGNNIVMFIAFMSLGILLPDIDHPKSTLGRLFYLPIEHRTWTHTVWFMMLFLGPGIVLGGNSGFFQAFYWIGIGIFWHLLLDSFSPCGVCWFYPISQYKYYPGGAKVKIGHRITLYDGTISQWVVTIAIVILFFVVYQFHSESISGVNLWSDVKF